MIFPFLADGPVQSLQFALTTKSGHRPRSRPPGAAAALDLVHLAVAEERPHVRVRQILDPAVREVLVRHRLVDRVDRAEAHRHGQELPNSSMRRGCGYEGIPFGAADFSLTVELLLGQATFQERTRVRARGRVTLNEDLVTAGGVVGAAEEVVEARFVQRRGMRTWRM